LGLSLTALLLLTICCAAGLGAVDAPPESPFGVAGVDWQRPEQLDRVVKLKVANVLLDPTGEPDKLPAAIDALHKSGSRCYLQVAPDTGLPDRVLQAVDGLVIGPVGPTSQHAVAAAARWRQQRSELQLAIELDRLPTSLPKELVESPADAIAVPLNGVLDPDIDALAKLIATCPKPVWATRAGHPGTRLGDPMRDVVKRNVRALAAGAAKVFWSTFWDADEPRLGFFAYDGQKMTVVHRAFDELALRLWPYNAIETVEAGPQTFAYRFQQVDQQTTTVIWAADEVREARWQHPLRKPYLVGDLLGALCNQPERQELNAEPLYFVEQPSPEHHPPTHHGPAIPPDQRPFTYERCTVPAGGVAVRDGWDWSLPEGVEPLADSGFFNFGSQPGDGIDVVGWHPRWKDWHTGPGQFDFSSLDAKLADARRKGYRLGLRLQSVLSRTVPDWVIARYRPATATLSSALANHIVAPWDEHVRREFEAFIREFGRRGYPADPTIAFASIHGISLSSGEEFSLSAADFTMLERETGLTVDNFRAWVLGRLVAWADAFGDHVGKLAWVGGETVGAPGYNEVAAEAITKSIARGIGARGGFVEMYNYKWNERLWGQSRDADGYLQVDEARMATNPFMADENEEYVSVKRWRFGLYDEDPHRWRISNLRSLQMRCKFLATNGMSMDLDRQLAEYVRRELGRQITDTPDAWCYLREAYVRGPKNEPLPLKNLERWLTQRDAPGAMTVPADRLERTYSMITDPPGDRTEYNARRTDVATGNDAIEFHLDDRFDASGGALLKVTWLDDSRAAWLVEYATAEGYQQTATLTGEATGTVRTATFALPAVVPVDGPELRLRCVGPGDVTVHFVRVVRL